MAFVKGKSGNPNGRPKENPEIKRLAQENGREAIHTLVEHMRNTDDRKASIQACNALLDRGFGKPLQSTEHTGFIGIKELTKEQTDAAVRNAIEGGA